MKIKEQPIMGYLIVTVIAVMIALVILMDDKESPEQAYERGKIDGQLLVFKKWGHYSDETIEQLIDCMHLRTIYVFDSLSSHFDSTDTMPAVEGGRMSGRDSLVKGSLSGQDSTLKEE